MKRVFVVSLLLSGCTFMNVHDLGDNSYNLSAHSSVFNSRDTMRKKMEEKANKICGENNYHFVGEEGAVVNKEYTGNVASTSQTITRTVKCGDS